MVTKRHVPVHLVAHNPIVQVYAPLVAIRHSSEAVEQPELLCRQCIAGVPLIVIIGIISIIEVF